MDVYTLYTLYTLVYPSVISLTAPVIAILFAPCSTSLRIHSSKSSFLPPKSPKMHFFCIFLPKNLQNPKCSSYLCTVFREGTGFPAKFHLGGHWTSCGRALHGLRTPRQQMHHRNFPEIPQASSLSAPSVSLEKTSPTSPTRTTIPLTKDPTNLLFHH